DPSLHLVGRLMAVFFSVVTLALTFLVGRAAYSSRVGALAALLMAFCLPDISGAHWLKQNSVVTLMALAATLAMFKAVGSATAVRRPWVLGAVLGLAVATR